MKAFRFRGQLPASKSFLNRLLVIQSFSAGRLQIQGDSRCDDVTYMRKALTDVMNGRDALDGADCGAAGTTFRFLALRASRMPGRHLLKGSGKLLSRPQEPLIQILNQLGVRAELGSQGLLIDSKGWELPEGGSLLIDRSQSSQFASAVLLSAWDLDFDLPIEMVTDDRAPSESYFALSEILVNRAGMSLKRSADETLTIVKKSRVTAKSMASESDLSSCFAIAALAAVNVDSEVCIENFPRESLQPDAIFPVLLKNMGVSVDYDSRSALLTVKGTARLLPLEVNLGNSPDLFPVLATLCAFARGRSHLFGAPHLVHKESDRIKCVANLLSAMGREVEIKSDGMVIHGRDINDLDCKPWDFDPCDDHRLAMAAALAQVAGSTVRLLRPEVVNKSFPEFWEIFQSGGDQR
jgi:3-phosphoshikimate 1-carboxyvinyltransferase